MAPDQTSAAGSGGISLRGYYLFSLTLPYIFPLIIYVVMRLLEVRSSLVGIFIFAAAFVYALPYFLFMVGAITWLYKKTAQDISRKLWLLPFFFMPVVLLVFALLEGFTFRPSSLNMLVQLAITTLVYGYFYVLLAHGLAWILLKCRLVRRN